MSDWRRARALQQRPLRVAVMPCAGRGERAGADRPKQYVDVAGRSVVHWTLDALLVLRGEQRLDGVMVVLSPGDQGFHEAVPATLRQQLLTVPEGGATRAHSVLAGLKALSAQGLQQDDWVLVHDAARCLITPQAVRELIQACEDDPVGGLLAHPVPDTLKRVDAQGRVECTMPREGLWAAQTPQMFRLGLLQDSLRRALAAGVNVTDEASALEWAGLAPRLVPGPSENFKVTYQGDFERAARLLAQRAAEQGNFTP